MREKIARAMWEKNRERCLAIGVEAGDPWGEETPALREDWLAFVDAGLEAMMTPTDEMFDAGWRAIEPKMTMAGIAGATYTAMLTAARSGA